MVNNEELFLHRTSRCVIELKNNNKYVNYSFLGNSPASETQTPGNYPKRNNLHLEHGESLRKKKINIFVSVKYNNILLFNLLATSFGHYNSIRPCLHKI